MIQGYHKALMVVAAQPLHQIRDEKRFILQFAQITVVIRSATILDLEVSIAFLRAFIIAIGLVTPLYLSDRSRSRRSRLN